MLTLVAITMGCQPMQPDSDTTDEKIMHNIIAQFTTEMMDQYGLCCIGGGGGMVDGNRMVSVIFINRRHIDVIEARELEVHAIERLLYLMNSNDTLQLYYHGKPFSPKSIEISIAFGKAACSYYLDGSVARVSSLNGRLYYWTAELHKFTTIPTINMTDHPLDTSIREYEEETTIPLFDESYEEALKIVQGDK